MPFTPTQAGRLLALSTPLGADNLLLERIRGEEAISELFRFDLDVLCLADAPVAFDALLGQPANVKVMLPDGTFRFFNGIVSRLAQGDYVAGPNGVNTFVRYHLEVVPQLWLASLSHKSRIFQTLSVLDILKQVLTGLSISWQVLGTLEPRDYCVQYNESDFAFASRLMEEEGIYYFFEHADGSHQMVIADTPQAHTAVPGPATISYQITQGGLHPDDRIFALRKSQVVRPGKFTLWDNSFELVGQNLEAVKAVTQTVAVGTITHKLAVAGNDAIEVYEYPGLYAQRFDGIAPGGGDRAADVQKIFTDNARTVGVRAKQETTPSIRLEGEGNVRHLSSGHKFTLADHFDANGDYVLTRVVHQATQEGVFAAGGGDDSAFQSTFTCIPIALPFVPPLVTPRPRVAGPQTATVVGPSGDEIFTDKYGRVKVQFNWDRLGTKDAASSCWIRVGSHWAGLQWGAIHIPRVGHEVIVAFEDGDPDRPIITGGVYNATNMPPYTLPDNKTQSGIKSRSSAGGSADNFNELRFEDLKDSELVYFHAEKDFSRVVENNDTLKVGFEKKDKGDQTIDIYNNQKLTVGAGAGSADDGSQTISVYKDRTTSIETGNETLTVKKGNRSVTVSEGDDTHTVTKGKRTVTVKSDDALTVSDGNQAIKVDTGNREVTIGKGNDTLTVTSGDLTIKVSAGKIAVEAAVSIELKVGGSSIKIEPAAITIKSVQIAIQGDGTAEMKSPMTTVKGDGVLTLKGGVVMIN